MTLATNIDFQNVIKVQKRQLLKSTRIASVIAVNFFKMTFRRQGFEDTTFVKWRARKRMSRKELRKPSRAILVQTGALSKSIRTKRDRFPKAVIVSDLKYSAIHNDGLEIKNKYGWTGKNMPKRQFMGKSRKLDKQTKKAINKLLLKGFRLK